MAHAPKKSNDTVNGEADLVADRLDNGYLRIYDGAKPADADTAISTQTLLAELRFANPSAPAAVAGVVTFGPLTADASANATGTATWARLLKSDGTTVVMDVTVGTAGADINIVTTSIVATTAVSLPGLVQFRVQKG